MSSPDKHLVPTNCQTQSIVGLYKAKAKPKTSLMRLIDQINHVNAAEPSDGCIAGSREKTDH